MDNASLPARAARWVADVALDVSAGAAHVLATPGEYHHGLRRHSQVTGSAPVILVHGWGATVGAFRTGRRHLSADGTLDVRAHQYSAHTGDVEALAEDLALFVDRHVDRTGAAAHLVGWSLGGAVVTALDLLGGYGRGGRVASVTTICTPHRGSRRAQQLAWLGPFGGAGRDLLPGAALIERLELQRRTRPSPARCLTIGAGRDRVVGDDESRIDGVEHHTIAGAGHCTVLERAETWRIVLDHIRTSVVQPVAR